ncbi:AFG2 [Cyberlindnera jadinii]|uniref:AFG2 protein n=1 Tax=Cyberlindnera jadinii (strain ATCC 18201 / CBS 1600 / BCRC 20928 / JCM 3617 / NBRC 0987 / NRRL Y-1542) TaxID=983966 RepID=A0A0H5C685_CYBJN|nr:AFG2 [Cyberlindnera jadinii]
MSSKASKGTPKKKSAGDEPEQAKASKVKVPRSFITRPSPNFNAKSCVKVLLHPSILKAIDILPGSLVHVAREGDGAGILAQVSPADSGCPFNVIQVSAGLRTVCNFLLGDRLEISKIESQPPYAMNITIGTLSGIKLHDRARKTVEKLLEDVGIVMPGLTLYKVGIPSEVEGEEKTFEDLIITQVDDHPDISSLKIQDDGSQQNTDDGAFQRFVSPPLLFKRGSTILNFTDESEPHSRYNLPKKTTYSQIGGLVKEIKDLKSAIELPLHHPDFFARFGTNPPRGVLLHGPPGTGKTMLLRAVAAETNAHVLSIDGPSIVSKYLGETESKLRDCFNEARKYQPAILFVDEIDSLAPSRDSDNSGEAESRVVATLLTLMDGIGSNGRVVIVAATNRPNSIDIALRRPGRFDREVEIGIPDIEARHSILNLYLNRIKYHTLSADEISNIASKTHGYVGADIASLCEQAVSKVYQRMKDQDMDLDNSFVTLEDFEQSLIDIRPSAMKEIFLETPKVYWSDIGGQEQLKRTFKEVIELPLETPDGFKRLGIKPPKGVLLYGPPGCSKTLAAKALATESGVNFLTIKGPEIFNKYVGESERKIREIFRKARAAAPSILFIDEIDALGGDRGDDSGHSTSASSNVLTSLLNELDGVEELNGVVVVGATNRPTEIDPALLRPGRLDSHIYVAPPDHGARLEILKKQTSKMQLQDVDLEELACQLEGCSGAEVVNLVQKAGTTALAEDRDATSVLKRHFDIGLASLSRGITQEMLQYFEEFAQGRG